MYVYITLHILCLLYITLISVSLHSSPGSETILYYTILYYTKLYYTIPYYTILYYTIMYCV